MKRLRKARRPKCAALVVAAGSSRRMGGQNKLLADLGGAPVLVRTLSVLQLADRVDEIVVAARAEDIPEISRLCVRYGISKCTKVIRGGADRVESALNAALAARRGTDLLAVHDGARPLATPELVNRVIAAAVRTGAAAPAVMLKDTVKRVREDGSVAKTLDRTALRAVQTPQVFQADVLKAALQSAKDGGFAVTDDCSAVERLGKVVWLVDGDEENLKITTPLDLVLARAILERRKGAAVQSAKAASGTETVQSADTASGAETLQAEETASVPGEPESTAGEPESAPEADGK